jgi:LysM repeat protein
MKRSAAIILTCFSLVYASAQTPLYILFNKSCIDQLEYKYTYYGNSMFAYSVHPNAAEQYLLNSAKEGITAPTLPKGTLNCQDLKLSADFVDLVNGHTRNIYMVFQRSQGDYALMPIQSATMISHNGAFYLVRGANYAFALDTTRLVNGVNIGTSSSASTVYFTGVKFRGCKTEYALHREPVRANAERGDFEFIPGIGITSEKVGVNATESETNQIRLTRVNGMVLDDYLDANCGERKPAASTSVWTPPVDYGNTNQAGPTPYKEPTKEDASIRTSQHQIAAAPTVDPATGLTRCPELPGEGYHIVQPGENLRAIARTYRIKEEDIIAWNKIKDANKIEICQKIWLRRPPVAPKTTTNGKMDVTVKAPQSPATAKGNKTVADQSTLWNNNQASKGLTTQKTVQPQSVAAPAATGSRTHKVKQGDYLYKIAKMYNCSEDCIRRANNMKAEGDVPLWPGQVLIIPECTCTTTPAPAAQQPYYPPAGQQQPYTAPQPAPAYNPATAPAPDNAPKPTTPAAEQKTYFTEHIVQSGETLNSVAYKYRVNAAELAQINGTSPTAPLKPGDRLLIPHKE